ncbi:unnamed protein product [Arctia plantaginis]|uniref:Succinate dehydrogenase assembly factor 4, mitochondrial n=1 Tax=Arctia plantaginis TaxID=874455 RepID=A0A8S1AE52_ARCPL|nr:unnamed protein product [Arctia plantaginis]
MFTLTKLIRNNYKQLPISAMSISKYSHKSKPGSQVERSGTNQKRPRETTPIDHLGEQPSHPPQVIDEPLPPWPNNTNPHTGEIGGPKGLEPTRYGDWERKGICTDF